MWRGAWISCGAASPPAMYNPLSLPPRAEPRHGLRTIMRREGRLIAEAFGSRFGALRFVCRASTGGDCGERG